MSFHSLTDSLKVEENGNGKMVFKWRHKNWYLKFFFFKIFTFIWFANKYYFTVCWWNNRVFSFSLIDFRVSKELKKKQKNGKKSEKTFRKKLFGLTKYSVVTLCSEGCLSLVGGEAAQLLWLALFRFVLGQRWFDCIGGLGFTQPQQMTTWCPSRFPWK